ncbi:MAG: hypothetical protein JWN44_6212 [Myxococcales bacterium]|nr:hypothetical protein [Myxococcales bacterium]
MRSVALLMVLVATGCGPIEYISMVTFQASKVVQEARSSRAPELAPYEYTSAVEYLHKAREVGGYARYEEAIEFGKKARDFGFEAIKLSRERGAK